MYWEMLHPQMTMEHLGFLPDFLSERDRRPAAQQINENYAHGGGWHPNLKGEWMMLEGHKLKYPGDPVLAPLAQAKLRDELIVFYRHAHLWR